MVDLATLESGGAVELCSIDQLWDGEMQAFRLGDATILLLRIDGRYHAYQGRCPHQGAALVDGDLDDGGLLTCAAHGWQFDAMTGLGVNPKSARLKAFPVCVVERRVLIQTEPSDASQAPEPAPLCGSHSEPGAYDDR